jgi:hypothetical protein
MLKETGLKVLHLGRSYIKKHVWRSVSDAPFKREGGERLEKPSIFFFAKSVVLTL